MDEEGRRHLAYLIRLWQVGNGREVAWRVSLQDVHTGQRHGFANLDGACRFLRARSEAACTGAACDAWHGRPSEGET
jgi:hypothetical protein